MVVNIAFSLFHMLTDFLLLRSEDRNALLPETQKCICLGEACLPYLILDPPKYMFLDNFIFCMPQDIFSFLRNSLRQILELSVLLLYHV